MATPAGDSPAAHVCKDLENRLDKAIIRCNEANHVKKIYQQVVEQLQEVGGILHIDFNSRSYQFRKDLNLIIKLMILRRISGNAERI